VSAARRDDRILPVTRALALVVAVAVFTGFALLYPLPDRTDRLWAWTIRPTMTPMLMGAGYFAGAYFFGRVVRAARWHTVGLGFLPVTAFAAAMLAATVLHWDRFNHEHVVFYAWTILYVVTPVLVPALWWANHGTDPGPKSGETILPASLRVACALLGFALAATIVGVFVRPQWAIDLSPWKLTPFTARVVAGWFSLTAGMALAIAWDARWSAIRVPLQSAVIGIALILAGVARAWHEFDTGRATTALFVGALVAMLGACLALLMVMDLRRGGGAAVAR
jgi:hypothetical protein